MVELSRHVRLVQGIDDVGDYDQLIRFALAAQLARVSGEGSVSQREIAAVSGSGSKNRASELSRILAGTKRATDAWLRDLDQAIVALAPDLDDSGGLLSLAVQLRGVDDLSSLVMGTPPSWTNRLISAEPSNDFGVLIRASAVLAMLQVASKADTKDIRLGRVRDQYRDPIQALVNQLIVIGAAPPTPRNADALLMLGALGQYMFEQITEQLEAALQDSPLGFQVWRAYTKLVLIAGSDRRSATRGPEFSAHRALRLKVRELLTDQSKRLRGDSLYPGRSLDLELAIAIPNEWSLPDKDDWVRTVLLARARNCDATLRERSTAAHGLWQRAVGYPAPYREEIKKDLRELIDEFRGPEIDRRPGITSGLQWAAATLEHVMAIEESVCNDWPDAQAPWLEEVFAVADSLRQSDLPSHLQGAARSLFLHLMLQNAGVERRNAIDTLVAGGWTKPIVAALERLLDRLGPSEAWLRIRAVFAIGFLQSRTVQATRALVTAFDQAYDELLSGEGDARISEMHAVLFAIGDCLGMPPALDRPDDLITRVRTEIQVKLRTLVARCIEEPDNYYLVARATSYMLAVTVQPEKGGETDLSRELLTVLQEHPDRMTSRLSRQALNRYAIDGTIHSIVREPPW